jgi:hypothetical protein
MKEGFGKVTKPRYLYIIHLFIKLPNKLTMKILLVVTHIEEVGRMTY